MMRLIVTTSFFHQGTGDVETSSESFAVKLPEIEKRLRENSGTYSSVRLTYELVESTD